MSDDIPLSPPMFEDPDAVIERKSRPDAIDALKGAVARVRELIEAGRQPGMPLSVLSNMAREAPLGSLCLAFLFGVAIGRRSR
ncbi:hypothetical protein [Bradyrhizobium sp.]|uniref:hypothetical protein n=1 Tax=Bradyrhizobium sp. TaxID=376 RepID=UPI0023A47822|nr:hypothetical protein [Bradyrhizobium sp.]MDE1936744.1 hypothetical protein [Bradyrhizobium sp.]